MFCSHHVVVVTIIDYLCSCALGALSACLSLGQLVVLVCLRTEMSGEEEAPRVRAELNGAAVLPRHCATAAVLSVAF